jgi:hypothetical protein
MTNLIFYELFLWYLSYSELRYVLSLHTSSLKEGSTVFVSLAVLWQWHSTNCFKINLITANKNKIKFFAKSKEEVIHRGILLFQRCCLIFFKKDTCHLHNSNYFQKSHCVNILFLYRLLMLHLLWLQDPKVKWWKIPWKCTSAPGRTTYTFSLRL